MNVTQRSRAILQSITRARGKLGHYVVDRQVPEPFCGTGPIRLIVLGQDPTVKNPRSRSAITTVLNLNKKGSLRNYLAHVCRELGLDLVANVYATNVIKNFFTVPPASVKETDLLQDASHYWFPLLEDELAQYPGVPIISLGEPVLSVLVRSLARRCVRQYWGYTRDWERGGQGPFQFITPEDSAVDRAIYPFPHQPSLAKRFYADRFDKYVSYVRQTVHDAPPDSGQLRELAPRSTITPS